MNLMSNELFKAVRYSLYAGATAAVGLSGATAFAQDAQDQSGQKLETITVTGSNIRRVDIETSNPVITIDRAAIQQSGKLTLGDLVQQLPAVTGGIFGPSINNGGGFGSSTVNLRGLGSARTLILVDGQRVISADVNSIPSNMVERIEVLTDGASAVYGSDAIAGVVNFILRKDYQGAEFSTDYGISDHDDGVRKGYHFTFGQSSDKGSIMAGIDYNKQDEILAGHRAFGANALDITNSSGGAAYTYVGGSGNGVNGNLRLPANLQSTFGCTNVAINPGANGQAANTANYHCFGNSDKYNYAPINLLQTPSERASVFLNGTYHLTDNVDAYLTVYHNHTRAASQLAPAIVGTNAPGILDISSQSYYNPFGVEFSSAAGNTYQLRGEAIGPRGANNSSNTDQLNGGLKGHFDIGQQNWTWDAGFGYGHVSTTSVVSGLPNFNTLNADLGPSFQYTGSATNPLNLVPGQIYCGTAAAPITGGCTPFNIFAVNNGLDPNSTAAIRAAALAATNTETDIEKYEHLDVSGGLFDLPAGTVQLAGGVSHRSEYSNARADSLLLIPPGTGGCILGSQCSADLQGGYTVKEAYAEVFIPLLKDIPFVHSLSLTLGDRFSKYSSFGSTNNWKVALEWRPIDDLLLRGTVSKVFRAPTVGDVYGAPVSSAPGLSSDPCNFTAPAGNPNAANPNAGNPACRGVPATGTFENTVVAQQTQIGALASGSKYAGFPLGPELGKSFDFGVVYDPHWLDGLSVSADLWRMYLINTISGVSAQEVLDLCFNGAAQYCPLINRLQNGNGAGQISNITEPTTNLGRSDVSGVDVGIKYRLPEFSFGRFSASINATYTKEYNVDVAPGLQGDVPYHLAGHFVPFLSPAVSACPLANIGTCTIPRWKANTALNWSLGSFDASWRMRYIGRFSMGNADLDQQQSALYGLPGYVLRYGATTYNDLSFGYNIEPINTRIDFGVDNVADKQPPMLYYDTNANNLGTDPGTFDVIGRYYHASITVKF